MAVRGDQLAGVSKEEKVDVARWDGANRGPEHFDFDKTRRPTMHVVETINGGGEALIEEVHIQDTYRGAPFICVRRSYTGLTKRNFQKMKDRHRREIDILKKLRDERHFIKLIGSYTQDAGAPKDLALVILQNPRADCDLASLLDKTREERKALISDCKLEKGIACLASALYFLHGAGIRHKDIASKNILVHGDNLLFADFGLSMDFSELKNSETSGLVGQQSTYRPPEGHNWMKHTCASDVFSLGCVFFEMLASLLLSNTHAQKEDDFQYVRPYRDHLGLIYRWLENKRNAILAAERQGYTLYIFWLKKTQQMLERSPGQRPRMFNIVLELKRESERETGNFSATACEFCMRNRIQSLDPGLIDEPLNLDFVDGDDKTAAHGEDSVTGRITSNSDQAVINNMGTQIVEWGASALRNLGFIKRWHLTFHLDNGRLLRMYGTTVTSNIDLKFDFRELLIVRVVFEAGTYGKIATLYMDRTKPELHGFRRETCDEAYPEGISVWRYRITGKGKT